MNCPPCNPLVRDLNGQTLAEFMARVSMRFEITPVSAPLQPSSSGQIGMFITGRWYELVPKAGSVEQGSPDEMSDAAILQGNLLGPILGVRNPRSDLRIFFADGSVAAGELEKMVVSGGFQVGFSLYFTS